MAANPRVTFVIETYNLIEGTDRERFLGAARAATAAAVECGGEVLVTDACGGPAVAEIVAEGALMRGCLMP